MTGKINRVRTQEPERAVIVEGAPLGKKIRAYMENFWGGLTSERRGEEYYFSGSYTGPTGVNFQNQKIVLLPGENIISVKVSGRGRWYWGKEKAIKLELNGQACQPIKDSDLAANDRNDPYVKVGRKRRKISFAIPTEVIKTGHIEEMQFVVGAGEDIKLQVSQPRLGKEGAVPDFVFAPRLVSSINLNQGMMIDKVNLGPSFVNDWGSPNLLKVDHGKIEIQGSNPGASGINLNGVNLVIDPGESLFISVEMRIATQWVWGAVLKIEVNGQAVVPDDLLFNGRFTDPYIIPFQGRILIRYPLAGILNIQEIQVVIGAADKIDMVIHNISIGKEPPQAVQ